VNKIIIDTCEYKLNIKDYFLYEIDNINNNSNIIIEVDKNVDATINLLIKNSQVNITISLLENSNLIVNQLGINSSININSNLSSFSNLQYVDSILASIDSINDINIIHDGNDSKCIFLDNKINLNDNKLFFQINGIIKKDSKNSYLEENSKIINIENGNSKIIPNLIVDNKDVVANHSAYIGKFSEDWINYLNSRGISSEDAKRLLFKAILFNKMENISRFINIIDLEISL